MEQYELEELVQDDAVIFQCVTVLAEDIQKFSDCETRLKEVIEQKLEKVKEDMVHNLLNEYDEEYNKKFWKDYTLEFTKLRPSFELIKSLKDLDTSLPEIKGINVFLPSLPKLNYCDLNDFRSCIPTSIQNFQITVDGDLVGLEEIIEKVTKRFSIVNSEIEGSLIKTILSKHQSAKEVEFRECNIRKLDASFKLGKPSYKIEKLIFNRCHFNSSYKHMKSCLTNLIIAMSKRSYKKTLKTLKLKVTDDADLEEDDILEVVRKCEMKCEVIVKLL